jgi:hypothetical protein
LYLGREHFFVSTPALVVSVLVAVRLLMPPGLCICKLSSPVLRAIAVARSQEPPPPPSEAEDDHHPGCPASFLSVGMGVAPPPGPGPIVLPLTGVASVADAPALSISSDPVPPSFGVPIPAPPLFVAHCALRF